MNFHNEYEILRSIKSDQILEISYTFNGHKIKIYFAQKQDFEFLTLVCENEKLSFVKNYGIYFINDSANINGFWGKYYEYAKGLANPTNYGFSDFYDKLRKAIQSVNIPQSEFKISYLNDDLGIRRLRNATLNSVIPNEAIYFHYIRRQPITDTQFEKVSDILGKDVAKYLKHSNLTAVFTPDITKQKTFILAHRENND